MSKDFYPQSRTEVALVRTDHTGRSNSGAIAHIQFTIKDDVLKRLNLRLNLSISNIRMLDSSGVVLPVTALPSSVLILPTAVNQIELADDIVIYPNPANDFIYFNTNNSIDKITVFAGDSKEIISVENPSALDISKLNPGLYCIKIQSQGKIFVKKIVKI
jgi:hypothetical protein